MPTRSFASNFGPYKIGDVTYKLLLPPSSLVHPVFHISLLKPAPPSPNPAIPALPDIKDGLQVPERVLQRYLHPRHAGVVPQLLIKWAVQPPQ
jgi:hypothetical protein